MKLLRQLKPIEFKVDRARPASEDHVAVHPSPHAPAMDFIVRLQELQYTPKKWRFVLLEKHNELFGTYPNAGISLEVVRARCVYRLQFEGHRLTQTTPSQRFLQNYKAMMSFNEEQPWEGCTATVAELGKRVALMEREVSMSAVEKTKAIVKKATKVANGEPTGKGGATGTRQVVLENLSVTETIRYMAKVLHAGAAQIDVALKQLGVNAATATIHAQRHRALKGLLAIPSLTKAQVDALKAVIPAAEPEKPKAVKAPKAPVKPATAAPTAVKKAPPKKLAPAAQPTPPAVTPAAAPVKKSPPKKLTPKPAAPTEPVTEQL